MDENNYVNLLLSNAKTTKPFTVKLSNKIDKDIDYVLYYINIHPETPKKLGPVTATKSVQLPRVESYQKIFHTK